MAREVTLSTAILFLVTSGVQADWPQFMGPNRDGVSHETGLARAWPDNGPKVLWTVSLGEGFGGASIDKGEVLVLDRIDDEQDILRCLDLDTGKELWRSAYRGNNSLRKR